MKPDSYSREAAVADGRLLDVSHLNRAELNPFPTFVSAALWDACRRARSARPGRARRRVGQDERIRQVITLTPLVRRLERGLCGEFTMSFHSIRLLHHPLALRLVIQPPGAPGRVV